MLYKRPAKDVKCYRKISLVIIFIEITNQGLLIVGDILHKYIFQLNCSIYHFESKIEMSRSHTVNNPFVTSQNHGCVLKQCKFFREVANIMYTLMMHKHNNMIIWMVKDYIILARLTHLTNFNQ